MVTNQAYLFLIFTVNGILIGLLFDFFRISRKIIKTSDLMTYIEDIAFWILTGILILYSIFVFNNGELRLFVFLGVLVGALFYMFFISSYVIKINMKIIEICSIPFKLIWKIISKLLLNPITFFIINIRKSFTNFLTKIHQITKKCKKMKIKEGILKNM